MKGTLKRSVLAIATPSYTGELLATLKEANLATETGLVVLDVVDTLAAHFRKQMESLQSGSVALINLFEIYLDFLRANHSETLLQQAFASMRLLISKVYSGFNCVITFFGANNVVLLSVSDDAFQRRSSSVWPNVFRIDKMFLSSTGFD